MDKDITDTKKFESRWPKDDDQLFIKSTWVSDAHIIRNPKERFYRMPMGYKRAGDILLNQCIADVIDRRNVIYAALFCYRQFIELSLKRLIDEFGKEKAHKLKITHDLSRLWKRFMGIVDEHQSTDTLGLDGVKNLITEMHKADQKSDGFRFPTDIDGMPFFFTEMDIDLANIREVMQGLENFFECAYLEFNHQDDLA